MSSISSLGAVRSLFVVNKELLGSLGATNARIGVSSSCRRYKRLLALGHRETLVAVAVLAIAIVTSLLRSYVLDGR